VPRQWASLNGWNNVTSMLWSAQITQFQEGEQELSRGHIHVMSLLFHLNERAALRKCCHNNMRQEGFGREGS
jgi:hypothetical protein